MVPTFYRLHEAKVIHGCLGGDRLWTQSMTRAQQTTPGQASLDTVGKPSGRHAGAEIEDHVRDGAVVAPLHQVNGRLGPQFRTGFVRLCQPGGQVALAHHAGQVGRQFAHPPDLGPLFRSGLRRALLPLLQVGLGNAEHPGQGRPAQLVLVTQLRGRGDAPATR